MPGWASATRPPGDPMTPFVRLPVLRCVEVPLEKKRPRTGPNNEPDYSELRCQTGIWSIPADATRTDAVDARPTLHLDSDRLDCRSSFYPEQHKLGAELRSTRSHSMRATGILSGTRPGH